MTTQPKQIKKITGYAADCRFWQDVSEKSAGYVIKPIGIPSPYAFSLTSIVYEYNGHKIIHIETAHRTYNVFDVSGMTIYATEELAQDAALADRSRQ